MQFSVWLHAISKQERASEFIDGKKAGEAYICGKNA